MYDSGSTGRLVMQMHQFFRSAGCESFVFCPDRVIPAENVFRIGNVIDHRIHALLSRIFGLQACFSHLATWRLLRHLKAIKPEVVNLHSLHSNYINLSLLLRYLAKNDIFTVLTLHDCWPFTGHCCHYTEDACTRWLTECHSCPAIRKYNISWLFDTSRRMFRLKKRLFTAIPRLAVVGNSQWTTEQARRSFLASSLTVKHISNWIDLDAFRPVDSSAVRSRYEIRQHDFLILGVAEVWQNYKRLDVLIEIARHMPDTKVLLIGHIPDSGSFPTNVVAAGTVSSQQLLAQYYSAADVFVSPSLQETFGLVSAEALACGTPIVVRDSTASPELAADGCGYVATTVAQFVQAISQVRALGKSAFSSRCRRHAETRYGVAGCLSQYVSLYKLSENQTDKS